jgi:hypothetical protein
MLFIASDCQSSTGRPDEFVGRLAAAAVAVLEQTTASRSPVA